MPLPQVLSCYLGHEAYVKEELIEETIRLPFGTDGSFIGELLFFRLDRRRRWYWKEMNCCFAKDSLTSSSTGAQYSYTVDDASVVTVSEQGVVTAGVPGSTVIEVIDGSGGRAECQVTVLSGTGPNSLMIETDNMVLKPGEERYLYPGYPGQRSE